MRVAGQDKNKKLTPHQLIAPQLLNRVKSARELVKSKCETSIRPPANHEVLKSDTRGTTSFVSSLVPRLISPLVPSKFVPRHPVLRNAECSYRVMQVDSAAGRILEVYPQRQLSQVSPRKFLSQLVQALRRSKNASMRRKLSERFSGPATINNNGMKAGRPRMVRDYTDKIIPPISAIPQPSGSSCHHTPYQGSKRTRLH